MIGFNLFAETVLYACLLLICYMNRVDGHIQFVVIDVHFVS